MNPRHASLHLGMTLGSHSTVVASHPGTSQDLLWLIQNQFKGQTPFLHSLPLIVLFSHQVMSNSLWPYGPWHTRFPCPSLSPGVYTNLCSLSQWCNLMISSSDIPFSSCPLYFPASGAFPMSQLFTSGDQSIGALASASVFLMNIWGWLLLRLTCLVFLQSKGLNRVFSSTTVRKHQFFSAQPSLWSNSHVCTWLVEKS